MEGWVDSVCSIFKTLYTPKMYAGTSYDRLQLQKTINY